MSFSSFATGSRSAPRDASDRSGRRPKSVYMDERQFRTVEDDFVEELPPRKSGALESKDRDYNIKAIHRSFATPAAARSSARKQVDEIVLGDEERRFKQKLNEELDGDRIARLREMNKKRLDALERKLADLQRQKDAQEEHGEEPSDGEHEYRPGNYAQDDSPPKQQQRRTAWQEQSETRDSKERATSAPKARPRITAQIPDSLSGRPSSATGGAELDTVPEARRRVTTPDPGRAPSGRGSTDPSGRASADPSGRQSTDPAGRSSGRTSADPGGRASADIDDQGYSSDPGARGRRHGEAGGIRASTSAIKPPRAQSARRRGVSKHEPFAFLTRVSKKSIQARRLEDELTSRMEMEEQEYNRVFVAKPPPKTTTENLFEKMALDAKQKSAVNRRQSKEKLEEQQRPFRFWTKAKSQEEVAKRKQRSEIARIQEELKHYGVKEGRMKNIQQSAWAVTRTDFTEAEQEELRLLKAKKASAEKIKTSLSEMDQARFLVLEAEHDKKSNSEAYVAELLRALEEELGKQQHRFRSVPVPKHVRMDMSQKLEDEARLREFRKEERKNKLASSSSLPRRMKEHEKTHGAQTKKPGDELGEEYTFKPKIKGTIPDFKELHLSFKLELQDKKVGQQAQAARCKTKPVFLRTEWIRLDQLREHERQYRAIPVSKRVAQAKLQPLNLPAGATQWDVIDALAAQNMGGKSAESGITLSELLEFKITSPSQLDILTAIDRDIRKLRDTRWPYTPGGRIPVQPTPTDNKKSGTKSPKKTIAHTLRLEATRKQIKERDEAKKQREDEVKADKERRAKQQQHYDLPHTLLIFHHTSILLLFHHTSSSS
ncbi:hypothetical protein T484DRAFT_1885671 [Baffinella frigidus]|nr:hypothetical protein T484DRAFT_1885671 [Cryptophyta sp. CCMP2293]